MKAVRIALLGFAFGLTALPTALMAASSDTESAQPVALSSLSPDELPLTSRFASLLTSYRNCVLQEVDQGMLGEQQDMARTAMSSCALSRGELRAQLLMDIRTQRPALSPAAAQTSAESGIAMLEPMIEAAAVDQAHMRYASTMY
jgi:hypothetical protein